MSAKMNGHTKNGHANGAADEKVNGVGDAPAGAPQAGEGDDEGDPYIRLECGRFMPGNRGGPGNPFARHTAAMRAAISAAVPRERLMRIADKVAEMAEGGNLAAARLIFRYCGGVPGPTPDPDNLDVQEMEGRRAATVTADDLDLIERKMPASALCVLAHHATPEVRLAWAEDRERREREARGAGVAPPARDGTTAAGDDTAPACEDTAPAREDTAPSRRAARLEDGLPDGADVEEALRGMREGDERPSANPAVTKRVFREDAGHAPAGPGVPAADEDGGGRGTDRR